MTEMAGSRASDGVLRERLAVMGAPISHSKSPAIHAAAYEELGIDWSYEAVHCEVAELEEFLNTRSTEWRGLSLTMPLKEEAHRLARVLDPVAQESGVVNTLLRIASDTSGALSWAGFNTDVGGLAAAIRRAGLTAARTVVLGSGATAVSAILAARSLGAECVTVRARRSEAVEALVERFNGTVGADRETPLLVNGGALDSPPPEGATLVISTLPGPSGAELRLHSALTDVALFDVAYDPWPSPLASRWHEAGGVVHAGTDMLVEQAILQLRIFVAGDPSAQIEREDRVRAAMQRAAVGV